MIHREYAGSIILLNISTGKCRKAKIQYMVRAFHFYPYIALKPFERKKYKNIIISYILDSPIQFRKKNNFYFFRYFYAKQNMQFLAIRNMFSKTVSNCWKQKNPKNIIFLFFELCNSISKKINNAYGQNLGIVSL